MREGVLVTQVHSRLAEKGAHSEGAFGETQEGFWSSAQGHLSPGHQLSCRTGGHALTRPSGAEGDAAASRGLSYDSARSTSRRFE